MCTNIPFLPFFFSFFFFFAFLNVKERYTVLQESKFGHASEWLITCIHANEQSRSWDQEHGGLQISSMESCRYGRRIHYSSVLVYLSTLDLIF